MKIVMIGILLMIILLGIAVLNSIYCNTRFRVIFYNMGKEEPSQECRPIQIVFLTDLHSKTYGEKNKRLIESIKKQHPDMILIGGDMFIKAPEPDLSVALSFIQKIVEIAPVYYANGNHEKKVMDYWAESKELFYTYQKQLEKLGVTYLLNESSVISCKGRNIEIVGLDLKLREYRKIWHKLELTKEELQKMVPARKSNTDYRILLAHNPRYFPLYQNLEADLVLSGHVHGGIMILPLLGGVIAPELRLFPKYDFGKFKEGDTTMLVSKGLGVHGIKFRIFNLPELTVIQI